MSAELTLNQEDWAEVEEECGGCPIKTLLGLTAGSSFGPSKVSITPNIHHHHIYQDNLYNIKHEPDVVADAVATGQSLELNRDLVGVKGAEAAMSRYELHVGIDSLAPPGLDSSRPRELPLFRGHLTEEDVGLAQSRWDDQVRMLFGEVFRRSHLDTSYDREFDQKVWNLDELVGSPSRTSSSPDVVDLTDSELSAESEPPPSTPNADKKSYAEVVFVDRRGHDRTVIAPSPAKPLNASALSFIPATNPSSEPPSRESSQSPYTSPTYEFHFPSLTTNPPSARTTTQSLPPNLEKDDQGFYIEIPSPPSAAFSNDSTRTATPKRPSASLLPAFLTDVSSNARNRHMSKTRAIVDRLRSSTTSTTSEPSRRPTKADVLPAKRSTDDVVMIKDNEADMLADPMSNIDGWITSIENEALASSPPTYNDGWMEGPSKSRRFGSKAHKRSGSSVSSLTPTTPSSSTPSTTTTPFSSSAASLTSFSLPNTSPTNAQFSGQQPFFPFAHPPYGGAAYGNGAYPGVVPAQAQAQAAYMQMQLQMQLQAQAQWQMQMQANARMQAGMTQGFPMFPPLPPTPSQQPPTNSLNSHTRTKSVPYTEPRRITVPITGSAGIRHA